MTEYEEILNYLYHQLPMFTRVGEAAYKPNLDNTYKLLHAIGDPHLKLQCVHIAGTNGKGSTSNMLASVLQLAGYRTGLYTSPHLLDFRERIRIDGKMISKKYVVDFVKRNKALFEEIQPSFFEMTVALCFEYFVRKKVDIAVIETGLGGRLDSTNVIHPLLSVITNIGFDHTNLLGNTLEAIAFEKAGIIKAQTPVVIGETATKTKSVFQRKAKEMQAPIVFADKALHIQQLQTNWQGMTVKVSDKKEAWFEKLKVSLVGNYQLQNIATTLQAIKLLQTMLSIPQKAIRRGLSQVQATTGFAGRWQILSRHPLVIVDTGHNAHGLKLSMSQLKQIQKGHIHFVFGVMKDKKLDDILPLLPKDATYYLCAPNLPRAMDAGELANHLAPLEVHTKVYKNVKEAYKDAFKSCKRNDILFAGGSTFVVAEVLAYVSKKR